MRNLAQIFGIGAATYCAYLAMGSGSVGMWWFAFLLMLASVNRL